jgi:hypothetical protein
LGLFIEMEDSFRLWLRRWWDFVGVPFRISFGDAGKFGDREGERGGLGSWTIGVVNEEASTN